MKTILAFFHGTSFQFCKISSASILFFSTSQNIHSARVFDAAAESADCRRIFDKHKKSLRNLFRKLFDFHECLEWAFGLLCFLYSTIAPITTRKQSLSKN